MKNTIQLAFAALVVLVLAGCGEPKFQNTIEVVTNQDTGLALGFVPVCNSDNEIDLTGMMRNTSAESIEIRKGALPWDYDAGGTDFVVIDSAGKITRQSI